MGNGKSTHVANAYRGDIYAKVDTERCYLTHLDASSKASDG